MNPQEALRFNCCIRLNKKDMSYKQVWFIVLQNRMLKNIHRKTYLHFTL